MAVDNVNNKSQKMSARVPHEIASSVESLKRRKHCAIYRHFIAGRDQTPQRKKAKAEPEE
jgi:hypothetical protein